jgi:hypothetical protein
VRLHVEHVNDEIAAVFTEPTAEVPLPLSAVADGIQVVASRVNDLDRIDLVLTGDFVASVQARLAGPGGSMEYHAKRGPGIAVAKTIPVGDRIVIVVPVVWFIDPRDEVMESRRRMLSHEALHAALWLRNEQSYDARRRLGVNAAHGTYVACAGVVGEEYRVEAALRAEPPFETNFPLILDDSLKFACESFVDAVTLRYPDEPIDRTYDTVMDTVHNLAIQLAYFAAARSDETGVVPRELDGEVSRIQHWDRLIGPWWQAIAEALSVFPDASQLCGRQVLDQAVLGLAAVLRQWLRYVGFEILPMSDDGEYFNVLRHDF